MLIGTFEKIKAKSKIQKEFGKIKFTENISLLKSRNGGDLKPFNLQEFDNKMLDYKKHFMFLTENEIIIVGCKPFSKQNETDKIYQKEFKTSEIEKILLGYTTNKWSETAYTKHTNYRTVESVSTGNTYEEKVTEDVPYQVQREQDVFLYGQIIFKNTSVSSVLFDFTNWKRGLALANKLAKVCSKLNIPYEAIEKE